MSFVFLLYLVIILENSFPFWEVNFILDFFAAFLISLNILIFPSATGTSREIFDSLKFIRWINIIGADSDIKNFSHYEFKNLEINAPFITNENDTILDTFGGSATTFIASLKENRKCISCEINKKYYDKSVNRIKYHFNENILKFI